MPGSRSRLAALACALLCVAATAATGYRLIEKLKIGGEGRWDYLSYDAARHRLFVSRENRVQVVDPKTGVVLGEIVDTPGVHGIALAPELDKGFTSNGRDNSITIFSMSSLRTSAKVATTGGVDPDFIVYDRSSGRVVTFNGRSANASVFDAVAGRLVMTIALPGRPEAAVADGRGTLFVDIVDKDEVSAIDPGPGIVTATWAIPGCREPTGLAMDPWTRRLFVGCRNRRLMILDADDGSAVDSVPIGEGVDAMAFDGLTGHVFSSQGDGTLTIVKEASASRFVVQQNVVTQAGARTLALDPEEHRAYLVSAEFGEPAPGPGRERRPLKPGTFTLLVVGPSP